jgi:hypothetical protein
VGDLFSRVPAPGDAEDEHDTIRRQNSRSKQGLDFIRFCFLFPFDKPPISLELKCSISKAKPNGAKSRVLGGEVPGISTTLVLQIIKLAP